MRRERLLNWDGCYNVRDLGGIPAGGRLTRWGAVVRSDSPHRLSEAGWAALRAHGVRTLVDLRNDDERARDDRPVPAGVSRVDVPLDDIADTEFWTWSRAEGLDGTPLYYLPFLQRAGKRERCALAVAAVARARPGGVVVHCGIGRDRTGLVSLLLLALVGVAPDDIAADYELSHTCLEPVRVMLGETGDWTPEQYLASRGTTARAEILATLAAVDVEAYLRAGGLGDDDLDAVRSRLLADG